MFSKWRDALRQALALRLGLWYAGLFSVGAVVVLLSAYALLARALAAQDQDVLAAMLSRYAAAFDRSGLPGLQRLVQLDEREGRYERVLVRVVGFNTDLIYFSQPPGWSAFDLSVLDEAGAATRPWTTIRSAQDGSVLEIGTVRLPNGVRVQVGRSSHVRDRLLAYFRSRSLEVGVILVGVALVGGALIAFVALAPLRAMESTTTTILQTRRFGARVPTRGSSDPLDQLGVQINAMLAQIETLLAGMRGALDNVAHDLRTPLTRFRNVAESALTSQDPTAMHEALVTAVEEADRLGATLRALMDISEAETGTMRLAREMVPVAEAVNEAVSLHADDAEERRISLTTDIPDTLAVYADRTRLRQVLSNIIENAVKYTGADGRVRVDATAAPDGVTIAVHDTGIGIDPADLPLVWDRLYRADASRSTRGLGLGLSLVKAIVDAHGGRVGVSSTPGRGSVFTVTLPAAPPEKST